MDVETDPFEFGLRVLPFAVEIYDGRKMASVWGKKCIHKIVDYLATMEPSIIYMHNGGRFDIFFFLKYLDPEMRIINGRIVSAKLGHHEFRDSYSIIPVPLKAYDKIDIDIAKLHRDVRDQHRKEIMKYLHRDCTSLYELVTAFRDEFGDFLTIGSAAMNQLRNFHPFEKGSGVMDQMFRKQFFFGGRVQCFQAGVIHTPYQVYDVNSMYPHVMKSVAHPVGKNYCLSRDVGPKTAFVVCQGKQLGKYGAFPLRNKKGGIDFTTEYGQFAVTIHEYNAALECGYFRPTKILKCYDFENWDSFGGFVDHFFSARKKAKAEKDRIHEIFYKLILNSAYGKFAQNPENFADWAITNGQVRMPEPWHEHTMHRVSRPEGAEYIVWKKGVQRHAYYHVAIGASITGAARALLLRGIRKSENLLYCDTDSIIAGNLHGVPVSDTELGSWKREASGDSIAIAGKKLYACFNGNKCVKKATKGARISESEIVEVARGKTVVFRKIAPTFKLDGRVVWIERKIRRTV